MKTFISEVVTSLRATLVLAVVLGGLYPVVVWAGGQLLFRDQANGSLVFDRDGTLRGSRLIAQSFASDRYFHPRPSSAGKGYDAANSSGSNLGPTSQKLADSIKADVVAYREENGLTAGTPVPADAVTRSGSGLDPHISIANAHSQAARVARARQLPIEWVQAIVARHTEDYDWRVFGEPRVNVLSINRALDDARRVAGHDETRLRP